MAGLIRAAELRDAGGVAAIWNPLIRDTTVTFTPDEKTIAEVEAMIAGPDPMLVIEEAGAILGFARYFQFRGGAGYRFTAEHTILLAPQGRGGGRGRALMTALADHARAAGRHSLIGGVSAENAAGLAFHAACGFQVVGTVPEAGFKFGRWLDLVLMQRRL